MTQAAERKPSEPFTHEADVECALDEFFRWPERKVLMLRGPWGSGKSHYLREVYLPKRRPDRDGESLLPGSIAYVSVFGCRTVREVEERILACLHPLKDWGKAEPGMWWKRLKEIAKQTSVTFFGVRLALPPSAALWGLARAEDALIVIDDIERADGDLKISEILGLVSGMTENAKGNLKVILVCNTEKLADEGADELGKLREKTVYAELLYNPVLEEMVERFFPHKNDSHVMLECLRVIKEGNIRIMRRVADALTQIVGLLEKNGANILSSDREAIIRLSVFFYRAGVRVDRGWLDGQGIPIGANEGEDSPEILLMKRLAIRPNDLNGLVVDWLSNGVLEAALIVTTVERLNANANRQSLLDSERKVWRPFSADFSSRDSSEITAPILGHLWKYAGQMDLKSLRVDLKLLEDMGCDVGGIIDLHVEQRLPRMTISECKAYLNRGLGDKVNAVLSDRMRELEGTRDIKGTIARVVEEMEWFNADSDFLGTLSALDYEKWLRNEASPDTIEIISGFFETFNSSAQDPGITSVRQSIEAAIRVLAKENPVNRARAKRYLKIDVN